MKPSMLINSLTKTLSRRDTSFESTSCLSRTWCGIWYDSLLYQRAFCLSTLICKTKVSNSHIVLHYTSSLIKALWQTRRNESTGGGQLNAESEKQEGESDKSKLPTSVRNTRTNDKHDCVCATPIASPTTGPDTTTLMQHIGYPEACKMNKHAPTAR